MLCVLTGADAALNPIANPVKALPVSRSPLKANGDVMKYVLPTIVQPDRYTPAVRIIPLTKPDMAVKGALRRPPTIAAIGEMGPIRIW